MSFINRSNSPEEDKFLLNSQEACGVIYSRAKALLDDFGEFYEFDRNGSYEDRLATPPVIVRQDKAEVSVYLTDEVYCGDQLLDQDDELIALCARADGVSHQLLILSPEDIFDGNFKRIPSSRLGEANIDIWRVAHRLEAVYLPEPNLDVSSDPLTDSVQGVFRSVDDSELTTPSIN